MISKLNINEYEDIINNLPYGIMIVDKNKNIRFMNQKLVDSFGNDSNELLELSNIKIHNPNIIEQVNKVFATGLENFVQIAPTATYNKYKFQKMNYYPIKDEKLNTIYVFIVIVDRKNTNTWQREFNVLFENIPVFISIVDKNYRIVKANQKFRNTFGNSLSIFDNDPNNRKIELSTNATALTFYDGDEHTDTVVTYNLNKEKLHLIVTTIPFQVKDGEVRLVMEISYDITEISKLQDRIKDTHNFYTQLIENSSDGIIVIDVKNKIQIINRAAKEFLGFDPRRKPKVSSIREMLPKEIYEYPTDDGVIVSNLDYIFKNNTGESVSLRFNALELRNKKRIEGKVIFFRKTPNELTTHKFETNNGDEQHFKLYKSVSQIFAKEFFILSKNYNKLIENIDKNTENNVFSKPTQYLIDINRFRFKFLENIFEILDETLNGNEIFLNRINFANIIKLISDEFNFIFKHSKIDFNIFIQESANIIMSDERYLDILIRLLLMISIDAVDKSKKQAEISISISQIIDTVNIEVKNNGTAIKQFNNISSNDLSDLPDLNLNTFVANILSEKLNAKLSMANINGEYNSLMINLTDYSLIDVQSN